jgi:hypothetical protein
MEASWEEAVHKCNEEEGRANASMPTGMGTRRLGAIATGWSHKGDATETNEELTLPSQEDLESKKLCGPQQKYM